MKTVCLLPPGEQSLKAPCFLGRSPLTPGPCGSAATLSSRRRLRPRAPYVPGSSVSHGWPPWSLAKGIASVDGPIRGSVARSRRGVCHFCPRPTGPNLTARKAEKHGFLGNPGRREQNGMRWPQDVVSTTRRVEETERMMDQKVAGTRGPGSGKVAGEVTWGNQAGHSLPVPGDTQASANSRCLKHQAWSRDRKKVGRNRQGRRRHELGHASRVRWAARAHVGVTWTLSRGP